MSVTPLPVPEPGRAEEWEQPTPLSAVTTPPPFPVDALPDWLGAYVQALATETQTPPDLAGNLGLSVLSTACARRGRIAVRGTWTEPLNIMTVTALPPGSRKSPVFSAMTRPLSDLETHLADASTERIAAARLELEIKQASAEKAKKDAAKADPHKRDEALGLATDAAAEAAGVVVPKPPRLIAANVTPEYAISMMADNGGRIALLDAEGSIVSILAGRYSSGMPSYDFVLSGHAGSEPIRVDRRDRTEVISEPAVTLGLAIQPAILVELANVPAARDKGLHARFLFGLPEDLVGHRQIGPPPIPPETAAAYTAHVTSLAQNLYERTDQPMISLDPAAADMVLDLERETEPKLAAGGAWYAARDWFSKWVGAIARLAGLLHLGDHNVDGLHQPIAAETVSRAITLGRYFADHALAVYDLMGADDLIRDARHLLTWITDKLDEPTFTARQAHRDNRSRFQRADDIRPALDLLEERGHIRQIDNQNRQSRGRKPSPTYAVHPLHRPEGNP